MMKLILGYSVSLIVSIGAVMSPTAAQQMAAAPTQLQATSGSELAAALDLGVGAAVVNLTDIRDESDCVIWCLQRGCAALTFGQVSRACQLLILGVARDPNAPLTGLVPMIRPEAGAAVWKTANFADLVATNRAISAINFVMIRDAAIMFLNTGTGRIGSIQFARINISGCFLVTIAGAAGGSGNDSAGGLGSVVTGRFNLTEGTRLAIVVGQMGGNATSLYAPAGGGGGSFVYGVDDGRLYMAAGGGGGVSSWYPGQNASWTTRGGDCKSRYAISYCPGGDNGQPGYRDPSAVPKNHHGGCGAGWFGKPVSPRWSPDDGEEGGSLAEGWIGGRAGQDQSGCGGFGGGGGAGAFRGASGPGGGYSGGGAGVDFSESGGAGGCYCGGANCSFYENGGHGFVQVQLRGDVC